MVLTAASTLRPPSIKPLINPRTPPRSAPSVMALSTVLRRAASAAAPLAIRALGARQSHHRAIFRPLRLGSIVPRGRPSSALVARFSSPAKEGGSDADILERIDLEIMATEVDSNSDTDVLDRIDWEIKATEEDHINQVEAIPDEFPFAVHDDEKSDIITLTRSYKNETIKVQVFIQEVDDDGIEEEEKDHSSSNEDEDEDENGGEEIEDEISLQLNITISKEDRPSLEFCCIAYQDELTINSMYFKGKEDHEDVDIADEGPEFSELDENLQEAFHKFLERRGITTSTIKFLYEYISNKERRGYLMWLNELKHFIKK